MDLGDIRAVIFDAGHTLVFPDVAVYRDIAVAAGAPAAAERAVIEAELGARHEFEALIMSGRKPEAGWDSFYWDFFYGHLFSRLGVAAEKTAWAAAEFRRRNAVGLGSWNRPAPRAAETLEALAAAGYRLGVISNSDGRVEGLLEAAGLRRHLEFVIDSELVGVSKPDPRIFEMGLARAGTRPEDTIYVGDYVAIDVRGARAVGIVPVLYDPHHTYPDADCVVIDDLASLTRMLPGRNGG